VYAIVQCGGHQVKMVPGSTVTVDRLAGEVGSDVSFDQVLLVARDSGEILTGAPYVVEARVVGVIEADSRGPKIRVFKKKRRKGMRRTVGHRSDLTRVRIKEIVA
jgi:large subunit ribosomal protein L21